MATSLSSLNKAGRLKNQKWPTLPSRLPAATTTAPTLSFAGGFTFKAYLQVNEVNDVVKMFSGMFKGEYDISEMSLAEMIYYLTRDQCDFIGIPVFPSRLFRHSFMLCNGMAGNAGREI